MGSSSIEEGVGVGAGAASAQSEGSRGPGVVVCVFLSAVRGVDDVSVSMIELCALMLFGCRGCRCVKWWWGCRGRSGCCHGGVGRCWCCELTHLFPVR